MSNVSYEAYNYFEETFASKSLNNNRFHGRKGNIKRTSVTRNAENFASLEMSLSVLRCIYYLYCIAHDESQITLEIS